MSKEKNKNYIFALTKENIDNIVNHPLTIICLILIVLYITLPLNYRIASHISNDIIEGNMSKQYISQIESIDNKNDFLEFINVGEKNLLNPNHYYYTVALPTCEKAFSLKIDLNELDNSMLKLVEQNGNDNLITWKDLLNPFEVFSKFTSSHINLRKEAVDSSNNKMKLKEICKKQYINLFYENNDAAVNVFEEDLLRDYLESDK